MAINPQPADPQNTADTSQQPVLVPAWPETSGDQTDSNGAAVDMIRRKLTAIYGDEPDPVQEYKEATIPGIHHSKHQQYMLQLHKSGMNASQIQTAWHQYYTSLNDNDKRQVWQEFYDQSNAAKQPPSQTQIQAQQQQQTTSRSIYPTPTVEILPQQSLKPATAQQDTSQAGPTSPRAADSNVPAISATGNPLLGNASPAPSDSGTVQPISWATPDERSSDTIRNDVRNNVKRRAKLPAKHHFQSLAFGLGFGLLSVVIVLFGFFNEVIIAPFIQPSRAVSATPIIMSPDGVAATNENEIIIPKINVEIPLDFSAKTIDEKEFDAALDRGVAHYPITSLPGQQGNAAFFGHSSNNIFNPGKYKFAFLMLNELVPGDTFYITYNGVAYSYTVYDKKIVEATQVDILNPVPGKTATALLVTCDPPGTSLRRLAVWAEQVSPNPNSNAAAPSQQQIEKAALPGNGPTLWSRFRDWVTGN